MRLSKKVILIGIMMLSILITGCSSSDKKEKTKENQTQPNTENQEVAPASNQSEKEIIDNIVDDQQEEIPAVEIRPNGSLPADEDEVTDEELAYYYSIIFNALQTLDIDTLREYLDSDSLVDSLAAIKEDPEQKKWWDLVVGEIQYFAESDMMVGRSIDYVFASWYSDCYKNGVTLPGDIKDYTIEEVQKIYDTYYVNAPFICEYGMDFNGEFEIDDGRFIYDAEDFLETFGGPQLSDLLNYSSGDKMCIPYLLLGTQDSLELGYDYLTKQIPDTETILSMNLDDIVKLTENYKDTDPTSSNWECFEKYYFPDDTRRILQGAFDSGEVKVFRGLSTIDVFVPADHEEGEHIEFMTEEEKSKIANMNLVEHTKIREYPGSCCSGLEAFTSVANYLIWQGKLQ